MENNECRVVIHGGEHVLTPYSRKRWEISKIVFTKHDHRLAVKLFLIL